MGYVAKLNTHYILDLLPVSILSSPGLGFLLVWYLLVKVWVRKCSHTSLLLPNSPLSVPALQEDLLRVSVQETHHAKVGDNLCTSNIQLLQVRAVFPNFVEKHVVWNIPLQSQLGQTGTIHCRQDLYGLSDIGYFNFLLDFIPTLLSLFNQ